MSQESISLKVVKAILAAGLLSFCGVLVETAMNITFPTLMKEFNISISTVQWMTTVYLLVVAIVVPLSAYLKRSFTTKSVFLVANLLFILGVVIDILAPSFGLLLLGRVVQGIGVGMALPLMFNIILEQVPNSKIGLMMGVGTMITAVAPALGPTVGGLIATNLGWRYIFVLLLPILVISLLLGTTSIEQKEPVHHEKLDIISVISIVGLFVGFILGINNLAEYSFFSVQVLLPLLVGIISLAVFVRRSNMLEKPIADLSILKNARFSSHLIAFFLFQMITLGLSFLVPNYIQLVNGSSATISGFLVFPGAFLAACLAPFSGTILDRFGARKPILTGVGILLLGLILFSSFALDMANSWILLFYIFTMVGTGIAFGNIMTSGQSYIDASHKTDANALFNTLQQFAGAVGTTLASLIVSISQSNSTMNAKAATAHGTQNAFVVLLVLAIIEWLILFKATRKK